jgi:hypothetical protein
MSELKHIKNFATFSQVLQTQNEEKKLQEKSTAQKDYADFFLKLLKQYDVSSPNDLDDAKKKEFFDQLAKGWDKGSGVTPAGKEMVGEALIEGVEPELIEYTAALSVEERNGFLGTYHSAKRENKTSFEFKGKVYEIKGKKATTPKVNEGSINEADIKDDESFKEYAKEILKKAHADNYDEAKAEETIKGLLAKKEGDDYGKLVGILQSSLG